MSTSEILHVTPVMPVDEHHIEYALDSAGRRGHLVTSWVPSPLEYALLRMVPAFRKELRRDPVRLRVRQVVRQVSADFLHNFDMQTKQSGSDILAHDAFFERVDLHARRFVHPLTSLVIGREFGCRHTFERARGLGVPRIYHLPTVHHDSLREILTREHAACGDVCRSTFDLNEFQPERLAAKEKEIEMADRIICPSAFVKMTLEAAGIPEGKVAVTPFGCESTWLESPRHGDGRTILFVGNVSARKGAHRLLKVWKSLGAHRTHRLLLVGEMHLNPAFLRDFAGTYEHMPRVPREDLRDIYLGASAMVLPALAEGFALVILEALSCGTPVLASRNSGAGGFVKEAEEARLFAAQDDEALGRTLEWALSHPDELEAMGRVGREKARNWPWGSFESAVMNVTRSFFNPSPVSP